MKLAVTSATIIYIACPAHVTTGGPELLHQLAHRLNELGHQAFMYYLPADHPDPVHPQLQGYNNPFVRSVADEEGNILLVPENFPEVLEEYQRVQKVLWWLSVDLHYKRSFNKSFVGRISARLNRWFPGLIDSEGPRAAFARQHPLPERYANYLHLVQSEYARQHLLAKKISSIEYLSDYLNDDFIARDCRAEKRDIVLFNPGKGYKFTRQIMAKAPDIDWIPIKNMTRTEVADLLASAKVYIDFGYHPGKDRIPREAAISGCCVITGKAGSAAFAADVPLPEDYKFSNNSGEIDGIIATIRDCFARYDFHAQRLAPYREKIRAEKGLFNDDVVRIFGDKA